MTAKINFKKEFPLTYKEYLNINGNEIINLNLSIDRLLFKFGIGMIITPVYSDKSDKLLGYESKMRIYPQNYWNIKEEDVIIIENFRQYKTLTKAEKVTIVYSLGFLEEKLIMDNDQNQHSTRG